eukprot:TRINITY_DN24619_c0_g3_i1.p2 TRINITY_DN24619_c0_g3~~TRINITY_DN24619_c0_g3_i1.p2  ORF type:complete len:345 (+),score=84.42 TRINITY_DN24619_c0_g3_i1:70-1104(+)
MPKRDGPSSWSDDIRIQYVLKNPKAWKLGAKAGDFCHDLARGYLKRLGKKQLAPASSKKNIKKKSAKAGKTARAGKASSSRNAIRYVVSLGSRCFVAEAIKTGGLRRWAGPFDWIYTCPEMVLHCLKDNFKTFLDKTMLYKSGAKIGHKIYSKMSNRGIIFPHHDPRGTDRDRFVRNVDRFQKIMKSKERKLVCFCEVIGTQKALDETRDEEARWSKALFEALAKKVSNFELLYIVVVCGSPSEAAMGKIQGRQPVVHRNVYREAKGSASLAQHELHCVGACTGLVFKARKDDTSLYRLMLRGKGREYDLLPDPLEEKASGSKKRPAAASDDGEKKVKTERLRD